jgi:hypothetical protein
MDAGSTTIELGGGNSLRKGGIVYAQRYNLQRGLHNAQGTVSLSSKAIEGSLVPSKLEELWNSAGGGAGTWSTSQCNAIYLASKNRVQHTLEDARSGYFGVREEYRIRWDLFRVLKILPTRHIGSSQPYWQLSTSEVLKFNRWELNRWLACLEYLRVRQLDNQLMDSYITMGTILARLIKASIQNEALHIDYNFWKDSWTTQKGLYREGLNLENSMKKYGLAWLPACKFDWQQLCPQKEFQDNCTFQYNAIRTAYQKRREAVGTVDKVYRQIQLIAISLKDEPNPLVVRERLNWLHRLCYREFSKRILESCQKEIRTDIEIPPIALSGDVSITWDHMHYVLGKIPSLQKTRRNTIKKTWAEHIQHFFEWDDGHRRPGWEKQLYRLITQHAYNCIQEAIGIGMATEWRQSIGLQGCRHFSILPHTLASVFHIPKNVVAANRERERAGMILLHNKLWLGAFHMCHDEGSDINWLPENQELWIVGTRRIMHGPRDPISITPIIDEFLASRE